MFLVYIAPIIGLPDACFCSPATIFTLATLKSYRTKLNGLALIVCQALPIEKRFFYFFLKLGKPLF